MLVKSFFLKELYKVAMDNHYSMNRKWHATESSNKYIVYFRWSFHRKMHSNYFLNFPIIMNKRFSFSTTKNVFWKFWIFLLVTRVISTLLSIQNKVLLMRRPARCLLYSFMLMNFISNMKVYSSAHHSSTKIVRVLI